MSYEKSLLVLLVLITVISSGLRAETSFQNTDLATAITELAEIKGEKVLFSTRPEGRVSSIPKGEDFQSTLSQLLSGTPYRFTRKNSYYLVGKFAPGSMEFALHAKRFIYKPKYLPAEELAQNLSLPDLRIEVLSETGHLFLQGLPEDLRMAKRSLREMDSEDNPYQVRFKITVIDIQKIKGGKLELSTAKLGSDENGPVEFITSGQALELLSASVFDLVEVTAEKRSKKNEAVARPSLLSSLGETVSFSFSRETISDDSWIEGMESAGTSISVTPIRKTRPENEVKTSIELSVEGRSEFNTTTWLKPGKRTFLGLLKLNQNFSRSSFLSQSNEKQERTFALYISAKPLGTLPTGDKTQESSFEDVQKPGFQPPIVDWGGLGEMLFPSKDRSPSSGLGHFQFLSDGSLDLYLEDSGTGSALRFSTGGANDYLSFSLDFPINKELKLKGRYAQLQDGEKSIDLGLTDKFQFNSSLSLGVTFYPFSFRLTERIWKNPRGWLKLEYSSDPVFASLRYASNLEPYQSRAEVGINLLSSFYLVGRAVGNFEGISRCLAGLRFDF